MENQEKTAAITRALIRKFGYDSKAIIGTKPYRKKRRSYKARNRLKLFTIKQTILLDNLTDFIAKTDNYLIKLTKTKNLPDLIRDTNIRFKKLGIKNLKVKRLREHTFLIRL